MTWWRRCGFVAALAVFLQAGVWAAGPAGPARKMDAPIIDRIVVHKAARTMQLLAKGHELRVIRGIQLGPHPTGPKQFLGDGRTPEGRYVIDFGNADSRYHYSLHISYPNAADAARARLAGRKPGGAIFIHGQPNDWSISHGNERVAGDWTNGCIALSDAEIESLWQTVGDGTVIEIQP
jgi:murein L,D-transpeptidase YafK